MLEYKGYLGHVEYDSDAKLFHGDIINTKDVGHSKGDILGVIE